MLKHPTLDQLNAMGLFGMAKAFSQLMDDPDAAGLSHSDWLALLLDREAVHRQDKRLGARLRYAKLRHRAAPEDIDYRAQRGLDRGLVTALIQGDWINAHDNLVITGKTGVARAGSPAPLAKRPVGITIPSSMSARPSSSTTSPSPMATAAPDVASRAWRRRTFLFLTIGAWSPSALRPDMIFSRSSKTDTAGRPRSSPASCP